MKGIETITIGYDKLMYAKCIHNSNILYQDAWKNIQKRKLMDTIMSKMNTSIHGSIIVWWLSQYKMKNTKLLEIGTFCGTNAMAISSILPNVSITTIDLRSDDKRLKGFYSLPANSIEAMKRNRSRLNSEQCPNISFLEMSSTMLHRSLPQQNYELIWIDGDHTTFGPYNDLHYALTVADANTLILMDDVFANDPSNATIAALRYLEADYELNYIFIQKRRNEEKVIAAIIKGNMDHVHPLTKITG